MSPDDTKRFVELIEGNHGRCLTLDDVSERLALPRPVVLAMISLHASRNLVVRKLGVYHGCSKEPVAQRNLSEGFQPTPWTCPRCGEQGIGRDALLYDVLCVVPD